MSGVKSNWLGLEMVIDFVCFGDIFVVWWLDWLGWNMEDLILIVNWLNECGVSFYSF